MTTPTHIAETMTASYHRLAAAYLRGLAFSDSEFDLPAHLLDPPLTELSDAQCVAIIDLGRSNDVRIHRFKRTMGLPRVRRVLGILRGLQPANLLDIGSGRGAFLWPLLDGIATVPVVAVEANAQRAHQIDAVRRGGVERLRVAQMDVTGLAFTNRHFDVVTMLEVLEHIPDSARALAEVVRVAGRFVILSVPSKPDNNPEHIHLFNADDLRAMFSATGVDRVQFDYVHNHMIAIANVQRP